VTVILRAAPKLEIETTPTAVHVVAELGWEATSCARSFCAAVVVTFAPPPSRTSPDGHVAVPVTTVLRGAFGADVTGVPVTSCAPLGPGSPGMP
jgi:hypothetical protein